MIRRTTLALALLMGACSDESDPKSKDDAAAGSDDDAGMSRPLDAGLDAGPTVTPDIVTNVGEACRGANACMGESPSCQTMLSLLGQDIPFPGGYCSAPCMDNTECGESGECPVGESLKAVPALLRGVVAGAAPSHCYQRCSRDNECRTDEGYRCATIVSAVSEAAGGALSVAGFDVSAFLSGQIVDSKYCLPPAPLLPDPDPMGNDAGQDAGGDAAGSDAGADAGTQDSGAIDSGAEDAADTDATPTDADTSDSDTTDSSGEDAAGDDAATDV